jgi:hypothetical protein
MCCILLTLCNWVFASLNWKESTRTLTNYVFWIVVNFGLSRKVARSFMGKRAVSRYFTEAHVKNKISICGINVLNPLNFGFRILWCELRCAHLDVPVEKQTRHKRGRVFCSYTKRVLDIFRIFRFLKIFFRSLTTLSIFLGFKKYDISSWTKKK